MEEKLNDMPVENIVCEEPAVKQDEVCVEKTAEVEKPACDYEEVMPEGEKAVPEPKAGDADIHGWFVFFIVFYLGAGGIGSLIIGTVVGLREIEWYSPFIGFCDITIGMGLCALACYAIYSIFKKRPDAIFLAKAYVIIVCCTNLLSALESSANQDASGLPRLIASLFWAVVWFWYLCASEQVNEIFPQNYRKVFPEDKYLVCAVVAIPLLFYVLGIASLM